MKKGILINASKDDNGTTSSLGQALFSQLNYTEISLKNYHIAQIGQQDNIDELEEVMKQLVDADIIAFGTPIYWSDMTGYLKTFIDRLNELMGLNLESDENPLYEKVSYLIVQGTAPEDAIPGIENVIKHISRRFFMSYCGTITNHQTASNENKKLRDKFYS